MARNSAARVETATIVPNSGPCATPAMKKEEKKRKKERPNVAVSARKNPVQALPSGKVDKEDKTRLVLDHANQLMTIRNNESVAWYDIESKLKPKLNSQEGAEPLQSSDELVLKLKRQAQQLLEQEVTRFEDLKKSRKLSSDDKYLATMIKSGTLSDRVAALTLTSQASPLHSLLRISQLITMASKKARRESLMAVDSLKDLFVNTLLPDNAKLRFFHEHPLRAAQKSPAHLLLWFFEHCLKTAYAQLTSVLAAGMDDAVDSYKRACLRAANSLLRAKPEQEAVLLAMLVNKLGDPDRKIAAYLHRMLQELLREHPAMKRVVVDEVERLLTRPRVSDRAKYNAVLFLNQFFLEGNGVDADLAGHLISVYFGLFSKEVHQNDAEKSAKKTVTSSAKGRKKREAASLGSEEAMDRKLLSALLAGVNRAFPYANATSADMTKEMNALFQVVHRSHHSTSVQALMLLFQVMKSTNSVSDRFYTALYDKLIDPKVRETSKHTLFLNLVFRAMKVDVSPGRTSAFVKRLLQLAGVMPPAFTCAVLFLLSKLLKVKPQLRTLLDQPEGGSANDIAADFESFHDAAMESCELGREIEGSNDEVTTEEVGMLTNNECPTDAERSAKILARMFDKTEADLKKSKEAASVSSDDKSTRESVLCRDTGVVANGCIYDASKRNPLFSGAETTCAWELDLLAHHYHPSVQSFTRQLVDNKGIGIQYSGDPLVDFTMHAFFEKFVNKKPRHKAGEVRGNTGAKAKNWTFAPINTETVLQENEATVDASDRFFYKFFKERASRAAVHPGSRRTKKVKNERDGDVFSDMESVGENDEEIEAFAQELAEGIMEDGNLDDEDPDMGNWSDSSGAGELTLDGEDEQTELSHDTSEHAAVWDDDDDVDELEHDSDAENESDFSVLGGMDGDDDVLQEELQVLDAKRKKQIPPKAGEKRKAMFASADDYDQIVKQAMAKQAKSFKDTKGEKLKKLRQ